MKPVTPTLDREQALWIQGLRRVAAVDEVGRGSLAGCVVAAAVIFPPTIQPEELDGIRDSKTLSPQQRQALAPVIREKAVAVGIGAASVKMIDRVNILRATAVAMQRALKCVGHIDHVLVDGLYVPELGSHQTAIVKGDQHSLSIAAASIIAKVTRDQWMYRLAQRYPEYGWATNVGYSTVRHRQALVELGPTPHHRQRFIRKYLP